MELIPVIRSNLYKSQARVTENMSKESKRVAPITWAFKVNLRACMEEAANQGYIGFMWFPCDQKMFKTYQSQLQQQVKQYLPGDFAPHFMGTGVAVLVGEETVKRNNLMVSTQNGPIIDWHYMPKQCKQYME